MNPIEKVEMNAPLINHLIWVVSVGILVEIS